MEAREQQNRKEFREAMMENEALQERGELRT